MKVTVAHTTTRTVPIYRWELDRKTGKHRRTDELLHHERVTRTDTLFHGSAAAYDIWLRGHWLPADAQVVTA